MGQLGDLSPQGSIAIGIVVGLLSTSIQSLGLTLQRHSHLLEDAKPEHEVQRPPYRRRRWQLGMFMFIISNIVGSTIQITTLPLPVLSTLQASGLVFNTLFATLLLQEPFTRYSFIGTILVCGGAMLIGIYGAIGEPAHDLKQLLELLGRVQFILWMTGTMLIVIVTIVLTKFLQYLSVKAHEQHEFTKEQERIGFTPSPTRSMNERRPSGIQKRPTLVLNIPVPQSLRASRIRMARGLSFALISGILSAHSLLVAKSAVELVIRTVVPPRSNQFNRYQSYVILVALLFFALTQLYYLHCGLRLVSTSVLYPFVFCVYNVIAILDGLIYFDQSSLLSGLDAGLVTLGTAILLAGVLCLSWRLDDTPPLPQSMSPSTEDSDTPLESPVDLVDSPRNESPSEASPLLGRHRRKSIHGHSSFGRSDRRPTLSLLPPHMAPPSSTAPRTPTSAQIWAELEDSDDEHDPKSDQFSRIPRANMSRFHLHSPSARRRRGKSESSNHLPQRVNGGVESQETPGESVNDRLNKDRRSSAPFKLGKMVDSTASTSNSELVNGQRDEAQLDQGPSNSRSSIAFESENSGHNADESWSTAPKRWAEWFYSNQRNGKARDRGRAGENDV